MLELELVFRDMIRLSTVDYSILGNMQGNSVQRGGHKEKE